MVGKNKGPEWAEVTILSEAGNHSNPTVKCNHCFHIFRGGASRIRAHLLSISGQGVCGCTKAPERLKAGLEQGQMERSAQAEKKRRLASLDALTSKASGSCADTTAESYIPKANTRPRQETIAESFAKCTKAEVTSRCWLLLACFR